MPSTPCYVSTQSERATIISPRHNMRPTQSTQTTISGFFNFGHIITEAVIVRRKRVKQRVMYPHRLVDQRQLTSLKPRNLLLQPLMLG